MSKSNRAAMDIGCPACDATVNTSVPPGPGIVEESDSNRLRGSETVCRSCGHELELYYY
ncbi:hypothetical protein [Natrialba sp. INN-245]|uniref:hypothetical protein n=1 Tax=Natrialba sp. INN-245 TaxID=2690967 RepID=UPI001312E95C|nr:hypothetical protein [Natrialba sp. INN-245]MWV38235.1 hypothetical protein [Natrialba sp. INN-245]